MDKSKKKISYSLPVKIGIQKNQRFVNFSLETCRILKEKKVKKNLQKFKIQKSILNFSRLKSTHLWKKFLNSSRKKIKPSFKQMNYFFSAKIDYFLSFFRKILNKSKKHL